MEKRAPSCKSCQRQARAGRGTDREKLMTRTSDGPRKGDQKPKCLCPDEWANRPLLHPLTQCQRHAAHVSWPYPLRVRVSRSPRQRPVLWLAARHQARNRTQAGWDPGDSQCYRGRPAQCGVQVEGLGGGPGLFPQAHPSTLLGHHLRAKLHLGSTLPLPAQGPRVDQPALVPLQVGQAQRAVQSRWKSVETLRVAGGRS